VLGLCASKNLNEKPAVDKFREETTRQRESLAAHRIINPNGQRRQLIQRFDL
jgi:hypothetical protein